MKKQYETKHKIESSKTDELRKHIRCEKVRAPHHDDTCSVQLSNSKATTRETWSCRMASFAWLVCAQLHFVLAFRFFFFFFCSLHFLSFDFISLQLMPLVIKQIVRDWCFEWMNWAYCCWLLFWIIGQSETLWQLNHHPPVRLPACLPSNKLYTEIVFQFILCEVENIFVPIYHALVFSESTMANEWTGWLGVLISRL